MRETMEWIFSAWEIYWDQGYYQYLLILAVILILVRAIKKTVPRQLLIFSAVVLAVFFCPLTAAVIFKCIGQSVYWRVLWLIPLVPLIAGAATELVRRREKPAVKLLVILAVVGVIAISGKSVWQAGNYEKVGNFQKIPDEVAQICDMINSDRGDRRARLATDDHISAYVRVYDPSIDMVYSRGAKGARSEKSKLLYQEMVSQAPDYDTIARLARNRHCAYLAVQLPGEKEQGTIMKQGYELLGMVDDYGVFVMEKLIK